MKRRSSATGLNERCISPIVKRTKVLAQRKFAQGSNNYVTTPTKLPKPSEPVVPSFSPEAVVESDNRELNNFSNLPTIDDFLTFLCYRETEVLPGRLTYLNTPQFDAIPVKKKPLKPNSAVPSPLPSSKSSTDQNKASDKVNSSFKTKKKVPEYKLRSKDNKCKPIINKTSRSLALKHNQRLRKAVQAKFTDNKLQIKNKNVPKFPSPPKNVTDTKVNNLRNHSLTRSQDCKETPKIEHEAVKRVTRRNSNLNVPTEKPEPPKSTPKKSSRRKSPSPVEAKELKITVENTPIPAKKVSAKSFRISIAKYKPPDSSSPPSKPVTRSTRSATARLESKSKTPPPVSTRPTRKTKEAATLYMETLGKDLLRGDDSFDEDDDIPLESFFDLPSYEPVKPKKETKESPKKCTKPSTVAKSKSKTPVKKPPLKKQPEKIVKPVKNVIKKDKAQIAKLNDELKKIFEDKPLKETVDVEDEYDILDDLPLACLNRIEVEVPPLVDKLSEIFKNQKKESEKSKTQITTKEEKVVSRKNSICIENIIILESSGDEDNNDENSENHNKEKEQEKSIPQVKDSTKKLPSKENHVQVDLDKKEKSKSQDEKNSEDKATDKPPETTKSEKPLDVVTHKDKILNKPPPKTKPLQNTKSEKPLEVTNKNKILDKPPKSKITVNKPEKPQGTVTSKEKILKIPPKSKPPENTKNEKSQEVSKDKILSKPTPKSKPPETKPEKSQNDKIPPASESQEEVNSKVKIPCKKAIENAKPDTNTNLGEDKLVKKKNKTTNHVKPVICKKNIRKDSSVKIIRAKTKPNEDEEHDSKQVSTSGEEKNEQGSADESSDESVQSDTPKILVLNGKEGDDSQKPVIQTIATSNSKMLCLESKKLIFKKNKTAPVVEPVEESPRKAIAFSADNENSVYAFEPDLPTTSPPFRRLKPVTPPKSIISGNSIAVQVNFENNTQIECSSSSETQVSSTTDCDDRVFYIPIQTSDTNSTLGVAVKLDTDGANQKIIMSATLVTNSPSFTTTTATTVASMSTSSESVNSQPEIENEEPPPKRPAPKEIVDKIVATADSQTSTSTPSDSPSSTVVSPKPSKKITSTTKPASQSVKIVKINKTKKLPPPKPKTRSVKAKSTKKPSPEDTKPIPSTSSGEILEAPTFYPSEAEFNDPLKYIDTIRSVAEKFGLCRIVPPSTFRPECKVADEMRFTAYNQYVHKMLHRWGPNVKEMMAIKKFLITQNIQFTHPPWIGGMEVDLPRLYQMVQQCGGLKAVIEKERWHQVADVMKIPKLAQDRITKLDDIYCKYLLPYDILSHNEREKLFDEIEEEWKTHLKNPNDDDELFDDVDECIVKGRTMPLSCFYRIARNTMMMCFGNAEGQQGPSTETIETEFWNHVSQRKSHICVHSGSIDTGIHGYGFSMAKNSTFRKHPWNLKVLTNNSASILRSLGPIMGVTVPTLHVGMLYSACCWYRDPHGLPWIEYLHTGANKIWYGIPDEYSEQFRKAMLFLVPQYCRDKRLWLPSDTIMIPPPLLAARNVPLSRVVQQPGQFIVVFPKSFTSCISTGYMVSESVYFAHASWLNSAKQIFSDMQESCEPSVFSLEQLLISVATDVRASLVILSKILPLLVELRDSEVAFRTQLEELGLNASEKMKINKKRKSKASFNDEDNYECEICRANLFISLVINSHEQTNYCLKHAVILLQKKPAQVKYCKLMYGYSEDELEEIIQKLHQRMNSKRSRKPNMKN